IAHAVMKSMYGQYFEEPKYRPSFLAEPRVAAGLLGRKTGQGWYRYGKDGSAEKIEEGVAPTYLPRPVWAVPELKELLVTLGAKPELKPSPEAICFVAPLGAAATTTALELGLDPERTVAHALLASDGVPVSVINDSPGFVAQRVVAHIVNVGCDIAQMRIASPADLDRAVVLGLGYPRGPLAMGDAIGGKKILTVLENMHAIFQEPCYRPSPWLRRRAQLGLSLLTQE